MAPNSPELDRPKGRSLRPLRSLWPYISPYKGTLLLALASLLIASGAFLAIPVAVRYVIDFGFTASNAETIDRYFGYFLIVALLFGVFAAARAYFVNWLGERVVADLRDSVYRHIIRMDPAFFEVTKTGEVLSRLTADTTLIQSISGVGLSIILRSAIQFVGALALLALTNLRLMGLIVVLVPAVLVPIILIGRWVRRLSRASQDRIADASGIAHRDGDRGIGRFCKHRRAAPGSVGAGLIACPGRGWQRLVNAKGHPPKRMPSNARRCRHQKPL